MYGVSDSSAAERLRRRYPPSRVPRRAWIPFAVALGLIGGAWLIWTAWVGAHPPVVGQVTAFTVVSDNQVDVSLTVQRTNPSQPVTCTVIAQAISYETVGQLPVAVAPSENELERVKVSMRTFKRATSASLESCVLER